LPARAVVARDPPDGATLRLVALASRPPLPLSPLGKM
jgi:hypothetical protein